MLVKLWTSLSLTIRHYPDWRPEAELVCDKVEMHFSPFWSLFRVPAFFTIFCSAYNEKVHAVIDFSRGPECERVPHWTSSLYLKTVLYNFRLVMQELDTTFCLCASLEVTQRGRKETERLYSSQVISSLSIFKPQRATRTRSDILFRREEMFVSSAWQRYGRYIVYETLVHHTRLQVYEIQRLEA